MSAKDKKRAFNLISNTMTAVTAITTILTKDIYPRIAELDTFLDDRKKFKAYETQCRMYF
jgi:hypothetical protein